jgi:hypothetical protein
MKRSRVQAAVVKGFVLQDRHPCVWAQFLTRSTYSVPRFNVYTFFNYLFIVSANDKYDGGARVCFSRSIPRLPCTILYCGEVLVTRRSWHKARRSDVQ